MSFKVVAASTAVGLGVAVAVMKQYPPDTQLGVGPVPGYQNFPGYVQQPKSDNEKHNDTMMAICNVGGVVVGIGIVGGVLVFNYFKWLRRMGD